MNRGSLLWGLFISILISIIIGAIVIIFTFGHASVISDLRIHTDKAFRNVYILENSAYELLYNSNDVYKAQKILKENYQNAFSSLDDLVFHSGLLFLDPSIKNQLLQIKKLWNVTTNGFNAGDTYLTNYLNSEALVNDTTNIKSMLAQLSPENISLEDTNKYDIEIFTLRQAEKEIESATNDLLYFTTSTIVELEEKIITQSEKITNLKVSIAAIVSTILLVLIIAAFMKTLQILNTANRELEIQVANRTKSIQDLLDHSEEGFLSFGSDFIVNPEYSKECVAIFGRLIAGENFTEVLFSEKQSREDFTDALNLVFSGTSDPDVVFEFIDSKVILGDKIIKLDFHLVDESTIMCQLIDITENEILQKKLKEDNLQSEMILRAVTSKRDFISLLSEAEDLFASLEGCISEGNYYAEVGENSNIIRALHTFKSNAAFLRMMQTVEHSHKLETTLIEYGILSDSAPLGPEISGFRNAFQAEIDNIKSTLGQDWIKSSDNVEVEIEMLEDTRNYIYHTYPKDQLLHLKIEQLATLQLSDLIARLADLTDQLARANGKRIIVKTEIDDIHVDPSFFRRLSDATNHILRNMVTHGIEFPRHREKAGKPQEGTITIQATQKDGMIELKLSDDGAGLSIQKIKEQALKTGKITANNNSLSQQDYIKMIFQPGFSTADTITAVSGRGYGLSAVRESIYEIGGKIKVSSSRGRGTSFTIAVPNREKVL